METLKKVGRALLFPHIVIALILLPVAAALLIYSSIFLTPESPVAVASYALAAYTLTSWCAKVPNIITWVKAFRAHNRYARRWTQDAHFRVKVSLYGTFVWNVAYAVFQLCLGLYHATFWYYSFAAYYLCLALMRCYLSKHTRKHGPGEKMQEELVKYRTCGWVFFVMNLALTLMIFFMVYWNRTFHHHEITTIAMAAYTFTTFTFAIINIVKYRKYNSPVFSATKAISLAAACVSMITLTSTMLTTFGEADGVLFRRLMLASIGGAVSVFIITMAICMIVRAARAIRRIQT